MLKTFLDRFKRESIPIFPLQTVLFPGALLPLRIFETRYMDMARDCLKSGSPFGVCLIKEGQEVGAPAVPETIGCTATLGECDMEELGILKAVAKGGERFRIVAREVGKQGLVIGRVERLEPEADAIEAPGLAECADFLRKLIAGIGPQRFAEPYLFDNATWVGFRLAEILPLRNDVKQKLLEVTDATLRLAVIHRFLRQQKLI
ncbi:MAG TPA: LON peptidase substrate-binding domain-containing protein [Usitatibacter sp.]|nr:LON peptidase substrate-binding domain-containing protein [Usitatibacter sp.]